MGDRQGKGARESAARLAGWASLPLFLILWQGAAMLAGSRLLPGPVAVAGRCLDLAREGPLAADFAATGLRALAGFALAMVAGCALGLWLGRNTVADRLFGPWLTVGLNLPALILAILCYVALGLTEGALILAVVLNKTPLVAVTLRQGVRALDPAWDEMAAAFRLSRRARLRHILLPQLAPALLTAARTGLALIWKIVLVFELLGADGGVGFRVAIFFQTFDMAGLLAYAAGFIALVMLAEHGLIAPVERRVLAWRQAQSR